MAYIKVPDWLVEQTEATTVLLKVLRSITGFQVEIPRDLIQYPNSIVQL